MLLSRHPVVTVESVTSGGILYSRRTVLERAVTSHSAPAEDAEGNATCASKMTCALTDSTVGTAAAAPWSLGSRRCIVKRPPRVWLPAPAPLRQSVAPLRASDDPNLTALEVEILALINDVRTKPAAFAARLDEVRSTLIGRTNVSAAQQMALKTIEGKAPIDELQEMLKGMSPVQPLTHFTRATERSLAAAAAWFAARDHCADLGHRGLVTHRGTFADSSLVDRLAQYGGAVRSAKELLTFCTATAIDTVLQLLIDDGDSARTSRKALLDPNFRTIGIAMGAHAAHGSMGVFVLVSPFSSRATELDSLEDALSAQDSQIASNVLLLSTADADGERSTEASNASTPSDRKNSLSPTPAVAALAWMKKKHFALVSRFLEPVPATCPVCLLGVDLKTCVYGPRGRAFHVHCLMCRVCKSTLHGPYFISMNPEEPVASLARGAPLPPTLADIDSATRHTEGPVLVKGSDVEPQGRAHCASCFNFRYPSKCDECGTKLIPVNAAGEPELLDGPLVEYRLNGRLRCKACFTEATTMLTAVQD